MENALALLRATAYAVDGRAQTADAEHHAIVDAIVDAICRRDAEAAETAARAHIASAQSVRLPLILQEG